MPHIYTPSIQASPHPGANTTSPSHRQGQAARPGEEAEQSASWPAPGGADSGRAQLSDQTLEKKHTPLQPHTQGGRLPRPPPSPDTPDSRGGEEEEKSDGPGGRASLPGRLACCCTAQWPTWPEGWEPGHQSHWSLKKSTCHPPAPWFET